MEPATVVYVFDEARKISCDIREGFVAYRIDSFDFQRLHEAFRLGVVVGIAATTHGTNEVVIFQGLPVCPRRVLGPAIRVMQAARRRLVVRDSGVQRSERQPPVQVPPVRAVPFAL